MSDWIWLVAGALASYRVARMLALEDGPFDLFAIVRGRLGGTEQKTWIGRGITCPLCVGVWTSLAVAALLLPFGSWQALVLNWLAIAGGMTVIHLWIGETG